MLKDLKLQVTNTKLLKGYKKQANIRKNQDTLGAIKEVCPCLNGYFCHSLPPLSQCFTNLLILSSLLLHRQNGDKLFQTNDSDSYLKKLRYLLRTDFGVEKIWQNL